MSHDIPSYLDFIAEPLLAELVLRAEPVPEVPGLRVAPGLRARFPAVETVEALTAVCDVYRQVRGRLDAVLRQRAADRAFVDAVTRDCAVANAGLAVDDPAYRTALGARDAGGRVVVGPLPGPAPDLTPVVVPPHLQGEQVTLFGPPDTPRMSINAMNALHRRRPGEPPLVAELVDASGQVPRWGADD